MSYPNTAGTFPRLSTTETRRQALRRLLVGSAALAAAGLPDGLSATEASSVPDTSNSLTLWYEHPATHEEDDGTREATNSPAWLRALPVGNGRLGGMVYGDLPTERIQLNEESLWSGGPQDADNPEALTYLPEIRLQAVVFLRGQNRCLKRWQSRDFSRSQRATVARLTPKMRHTPR
jgi:hypothetical protein